MERLAEEFAEGASFFNVWVREPHAGGDYPQPQSIEERRRYARDFCAADGPRIPVIVDDMEGSLHARFGYFPNAVYVIEPGGRVAYRAVWTDHREVRRVLEKIRAAGERRARGENAGFPVFAEEMLFQIADDPDRAAVQSIVTWEQARNYDEPERFMGEERAAQLRAAYERATGNQSVRPQR